MKYAIQADYYMWDDEMQKEYSQWLYLGTEGEHKIFVFHDNVDEGTKLFDTAKEAGEYVDKHFSPDDIRCSFSKIRIVEIEKE